MIICAWVCIKTTEYVLVLVEKPDVCALPEIKLTGDHTMFILIDRIEQSVQEELQEETIVVKELMNE